MPLGGYRGAGGTGRETTYLFQQLSAAQQNGNMVSFQNMFTAG